MNQTGANGVIYTLLAALVFAVCGCQIPNRTYRSGIGTDTAPVISVTTPEKLPLSKSNPWPAHPEAPCDKEHLSAQPCLAFLEFDDFGEPWQRTGGTKSNAGRPTQLDDAVQLIVKAKQQDPFGEPLILTFIHGWKHNASQGNRSGADDDNVIGVESMLNRLHDVEWKGHVVIGIYIAWRGGLISPYWPVSQQFTYWNREATAARVGNASLTDALIEISDAAKRVGDCKEGSPCYQSIPCVKSSAGTQDLGGQGASTACSPIFLLIGHSFGALVLERALSQAIVTRMEAEWNTGRLSEASQSTRTVNIVPLASLVIYVNSAAAATESKQVMDYLASSEYKYQPHPDGKDQPLFLSITSEADLATGLLLKVGHALPWLGYKWNGSLRAKPSASPVDGKPTTSYARACFDPSKEKTSDYQRVRYDLSEGDYYMTTTAHKEALWSHTVTQQPAPPNATQGCAAGLGDDIYKTCTIDDYAYVIAPAANRCNGTPYWVLQVQKELIPDHTTIFTEKLIAFLKAFIPAPPPEGGPVVDRPQLTRPLE